MGLGCGANRRRGPDCLVTHLDAQALVGVVYSLSMSASNVSIGSPFFL